MSMQGPEILGRSLNGRILHNTHTNITNHQLRSTRKIKVKSMSSFDQGGCGMDGGRRPRNEDAGPRNIRAVLEQDRREIEEWRQ